MNDIALQLAAKSRVTPHLRIVGGIEAAPLVDVGADTVADRERLRSWLERSSSLDALARFASFEWEEAFADDVDDVGFTTISGGVHADETYFEVAEALDLRWFATRLCRLGAEDPTRPSLERFCRERLPELWADYIRWRDRPVSDDRPETLGPES
jgi:hypothetical protein